MGAVMSVYLALGDSISIDEYTGVRGGGAVSQLARKLGVELVDLTRDGNTTQGVLADLVHAPTTADIVTLTAGGNDLIRGEPPRAILGRLRQIADQIQSPGARVVINTVYDPVTATTISDGASWGCLGRQRSSYDGASIQRMPESRSSLASTASCSPISSSSSTGTASPPTNPGLSE
jgi:lysophospholipase L1-like esterase